MRLFLILLILISPLSAVAGGESAVFNPIPPKGMSYLRVINAVPKVTSLSIFSGSLSFYDTTYRSVSNYKMIHFGHQRGSYLGKEFHINIAPGRYYTLAVLPDGKLAKHVLFEDKVLDVRTKSRIFFYNLSDISSAMLSIPKYHIDIFSDIKVNTSDSRNINPVEFSLAVTGDDYYVRYFENIKLKKQESVSIFLTGFNGEYDATLVSNSTILF